MSRSSHGGGEPDGGGGGGGGEGHGGGGEGRGGGGEGGGCGGLGGKGGGAGGQLPGPQLESWPALVKTEVPAHAQRMSSLLASDKEDAPCRVWRGGR